MNRINVKERIESAANSISGMNFIHGFIFEERITRNRDFPVVILHPSEYEIINYNRPQTKYEIELYIENQHDQDDSTTYDARWKALDDYMVTLIDYIKSVVTVVTPASKTFPYILEGPVKTFPFLNDAKHLFTLQVKFTLIVKDCRNI